MSETTQDTAEDDVERRVALVTGGSRGIGRAIVVALARRGLTVVINYRSDQAAAESLRAELAEAGHTITLARADVSDRGEVKAMFKALRRDHGRLDVLINCAGVLHEGLFMFTPADRFWEVLRTNLGGVEACCRAAIPSLSRRRDGRIVNIASIAAIHATAGLSAYAASKAAVIALSQVLARELAGIGVRVNVVAPGLVETDMTAGMVDETARERALSQQPIPRIGRPEEVANLVTYLALDAPDYMTGTVQRIDGGAMIGG